MRKMYKRGSPDFYQENKIKKITNTVLRYYDCPEDCPSICCRNDCIPIFANEAKVLKKIMPSCEIMDTDLDFMKELKNPCPFLDQNFRCIAYKKRPEICRIFPIVRPPGTPEGYLYIVPCKLGLKIYLDYLNFELVKAEKAGFSDEEIEEERSRAMKYYEVLETAFSLDVKPGEQIPGIYVPIAIFEKFASWLKSGKSENFNYNF